MNSYKDIFEINDLNYEAMEEQKNKIDDYFKKRLAGKLSLVSSRKSYAVTRYEYEGDPIYIARYGRGNKRTQLQAELMAVTDSPGLLTGQEGSRFIVEIENDEPREFHYGSAIDLIDEFQDDELKTYVGESVKGKPLIIDFKVWRYLLIGGIQGSGKSICLHNLLLSLLYRYSQDDINVYMIDNIKRVEMAPYKGIKSVKEVVLDKEGTIPLLEKITEEINERGDLMLERGFQNLEDHNRELPEYKLPHIFLIIEEADTLLNRETLSKEERQKAISLLENLAKVGRYAGLHIILTSQRPSVENIGSNLRSQMDARIALKVDSATDSRFIIQTGEAAKLRGKGDAYFKNEDSLERFQTASLSHDELKSAIEWLKNK